MQPCIAPANPDDHGQPINYAPKYTFVRPVTDEDRQRAAESRALLVRHTLKTLNIFSEDSEDC